MIEIWVFTALAAAFFSASKSMIQKHLTEEFNSIQISYIGSVLGFVFLIPLGIYGYIQTGIPVDPLVWGGLFLSGAGNVVGLYIFIRALSLTDISLISPIRRSTPVLVSVMEPLILGITYSVNIVAGALITVAGSIIVISDRGIGRIPEPNRGLLFALSLPLIYSVVVIGERYATQNMSPFLFSFLVYTVLAASYTALARKRKSTVATRKLFKPVILAIGLVSALGSVFIFYSLSIASASEVTIVKQSVIIFNVIIGGKIFSEDRLLQKVAGSLLVIAGIFLTI